MAKQNKSISITRLIIWVVILAIILTGLLIYWQYQKYYPSTDDAYIRAHIVNIAPQVTGPIAHIYVKNNQFVQKGQKLFDIDPAPFEIAVQDARAERDLTQQKIKALEATIKSAKALVAQRVSEQDVTEKDAHRIFALVKTGQATKQSGDDMRSKVQVAQAALDAANSELEKAREQLGKLGKQNAQLRAAEARLNQTKLDLKHTHITAPAAGQIVNFTARVGSMVQQGITLFNIVEDNSWWADANFKETHLERIKNGQSATVIVDIYPNHKFQGYVQSISAGSGAAFSILPPENATGNWVKVTQRVPVKVIIKNPSKQFPLRVGASATVRVDTTAKIK